MKIHAHAAMARAEELKPWTYDAEGPTPQEVIVEVESCGVCWSDVDMIDNNRGLSNYPLVPGHEVVGRVVETGTEVHGPKKGDRVGIGWWRGACLECEMCLSGRENLCSERKATIVNGYGGFADHIVVDSHFAYRWPENLDPIKGAPLLCAGHAVFGALTTAGMTSRQEIGIIGFGGLGHIAVQFAAAQGNRVTVFTHSDDKANAAVSLGAHEVVVVKPGETPKVRKPLNILLTTAPANLNFNEYLDLLAPDGVLAFSSKPPKPIELDVNRLMGWRRRMLGNPTGGRSMMVQMLAAADRYGIEPIVETFPMAQANEAIAKIRANTIRHRGVLIA